MWRTTHAPGHEASLFFFLLVGFQMLKWNLVYSALQNFCPSTTSLSLRELGSRSHNFSFDVLITLVHRLHNVFFFVSNSLFFVSYSCHSLTGGLWQMGGDSSHYLEQVVEYGHLQPGQTKVSAIKQYPVPTTKKTGMCYYHSFCRNHLTVEASLTDLLEGKARQPFETVFTSFLCSTWYRLSFEAADASGLPPQPLRPV